MADWKLPELELPKPERRDFWHIGSVYVWKYLALAALCGGAALVLAVFGPPSFPALSRDPPSYRFDDPNLAAVSGTVRVLDSAGTVRYEGEVAAGAYTGRGKVYDSGGVLVYDGPLADGAYEGPDARVYDGGVLVYEGEMAQNLYECQGRRIDPATGTVSEGAFSHGTLEGEGRELTRGGVLLREGTFSGGVLNGAGKEFRTDGTLLREGTFVDGLLQGEGVEYATDGGAAYEGTFRRGVRQGQGRLYDTGLDAVVYEGEFRDGMPQGTGRVYHPSGQVLYEGPVFDGRPRADAFLGLSLAEVEAAFSEHWTAYICGGITAFVYPSFHLMFATEYPAELVPAPEEDAEEVAIELEGIAEVETEEEPVSSPEPGDIVITEVLSYGGTLAGTAQPEMETPSGRRWTGWRERFCDFAVSSNDEGAMRTGPFIYEFEETDNAGRVDFYLAEQGGVQTTTVPRSDKDGSLWYQSAVREDGA